MLEKEGAKKSCLLIFVYFVSLRIAVREDRMPGGRNSGAVYNLYKVPVSRIHLSIFFSITSLYESSLDYFAGQVPQAQEGGSSGWCSEREGGQDYEQQ